MVEYETEYKYIVILVVIVVGILFGGKVYHAYMESRSYENVTGKKVSTWDALFLELRVDGCEK